MSGAISKLWSRVGCAIEAPNSTLESVDLGAPSASVRVSGLEGERGTQVRASYRREMRDERERGREERHKFVRRREERREMREKRGGEGERRREERDKLVRQIYQR